MTTPGQAAEFGWHLAAACAPFVMLVAVFLLGFSLVRMIGGR